VHDIMHGHLWSSSPHTRNLLITDNEVDHAVLRIRQENGHWAFANSVAASDSVSGISSRAERLPRSTGKPLASRPEADEAEFFSADEGDVVDAPLDSAMDSTLRAADGNRSCLAHSSIRAERSRPANEGSIKAGCSAMMEQAGKTTLQAPLPVLDLEASVAVGPLDDLLRKLRGSPELFAATL